MVQASKELEMMPTTEGALDLKLDLTHVIDGFHGNEHTLPITPLFKDVLQMFAQSGIAETPTLIVNYGGPFGEDYWYEYSEVHDNAKLNRFTPHRIIDENQAPAELVPQRRIRISQTCSAGNKTGTRRRAGWSWQSRTVAGPRVPLGNVDAGQRRHDASGGAEVRDD
jgi:hypothetical protein